MAVSPIQSSFLGGELSPSFHGRVDLDIYRQGARELFNVLPSVGGSLRSRQGSQMFHAMPGSFDRAQFRGKVAVIPGAGRHGYLATFYESYVQVRDIDGTLECLNAGRDPAISYPLTAAFEQISGAPDLGIDVAGATVAQPEGPETGSNWNNVPLGERDQNVSSYSGGSDRYTTPIVPAPIIFEVASIRLGYSGWAKYAFTPKEVGTHRLRFTIYGEDAMAGSLLRIQVGNKADFNDFKGTIQGTLMFESAVGLGNDPQVPRASSRFFEIEVPITSTANTLVVGLKFLSRYGPDDYLFYGNPEKNSVCFANVSMHAPSGVATLATPYNEDDFWLNGKLSDLRTVPLPVGAGNAPLGNGRYELLLLHPDVAPHILTVRRNGSFSVEAAGGILDPDWAPGNYPTIGAVWQGRLWLSGCAQYPDRFWASQPGRWLDFSPPSSPPTAEDAMDFQIGHGRVQWMAGAQTFLIGTDAGEYALHAAGGVVSPLDFQLTQQSSFGGAAIPAVPFGNVVGYVTADRRRINTPEFSNERGAWWSKGVTLAAEHLFRGSPIAELGFAPSPEPTIVVRREDGTLAFCLFDPGAGVAAWSTGDAGWQEEGAPGVTSIAFSRGLDGVRLWQLVRRTGTGEELWSSVETVLMGPPREDAFHIDGAWRKTSTIPGPHTIGPFVGLGNWQGLGFDVWVDGVRYAAGGFVNALLEFEFNSNARAAIRAGSVIEWGWAFTRRVKLLGLEVQGSRPGTGQGTKRRSPRILLRLTEGSSVPRVNLAETPKAFAGAAGEGTLDYVVASDNWGRGMVTLDTAEAKPLELLAIFGVAQANEV